MKSPCGAQAELVGEVRVKPRIRNLLWGGRALWRRPCAGGQVARSAERGRPCAGGQVAPSAERSDTRPFKPKSNSQDTATTQLNGRGKQREPARVARWHRGPSWEHEPGIDGSSCNPACVWKDRFGHCVNSWPRGSLLAPGSALEAVVT